MQVSHWLTNPSYRRAPRFFDELPGRMGLPVLGQSPQYFHDPVRYILRNYRQYGPAFKVNVLGRAVFVMIGQEANELVLTNRGDRFSNYGGWKFALDRLFHDGLILRDGDDHRAHRRLMQTAFTRSALQSYLQSISETVDAFLDGLDTGAWRPVMPELKRLTLNTAARSFMGEPMGPRLDAVNRAFVATVAGTLAFWRRETPPGLFWRGMRGRRYLERYFAEELRRRRMRGEAGSDLLSRLMGAEDEAGQVLTDREIIDHMIFLMMAAHDTNTATLTSLIYHLGIDPEWQAELREEADQFASDGSVIDAERLRRGHVKLDWTIKEVLRMHAPVFGLPRQTVRPFEFAGYEVPAGVMVGVVPGVTHYMHEYFSEPRKFDPFRYAPGREEHRRVPFTYIPFGHGQHRCLGELFAGLQITMIVNKLLRRYRWRVPRWYVPFYNEVPINAPMDGVPVRFEPRLRQARQAA